MSEVVYRINRPEVIDEQFEDEYVLVNLRTGAYFSLSVGGAVVWDALASGATFAEILQHVGALYQGEPAEIKVQVSAILSDMEREALISPEDSSANEHAARAATPEAPSPRPVFPQPRLEKYTDMQALLLLDPIHQVDETGWPSKLTNAS